MSQVLVNNRKFYISRAQYEYDQLVDINNYSIDNEKFNHLVLFCGKGISHKLVSAMNTIAELTKNSNLIVGITDRGDLDDKSISRYVHKIPLIIGEENVPKGVAYENYFFCELKSATYYLSLKKIEDVTYFTRVRKDIFLDVIKFLDYLQSVKFLFNKYNFITVTNSTNVLRRLCFSDMFFTTPLNLINNIPYRKIPERKNLFWFHMRYLKPHEIFKNDHQMEQWLWFHLLNNFGNVFDNQISIRDYWKLMENYILVLNPKEIGYIWNRSSDVYLNNWEKYSPNGKGFFKTTRPMRNFLNYSNFMLYLLTIKSNLSNYFIKYRRLIFIQKSFYLIIFFPFYYLKYLKKYK